MSKSLPGLPHHKSRLSNSELIVANGFALAEAMGISEQEFAASCIKFAVTAAEKQGDPDGWLAILTNQHKGA